MGATPRKNRPEYRGPDPRCISIVQDMVATMKAIAQDPKKGAEGRKTLLLLAESVAPAVDWLWAPRVTLVDSHEDILREIKRGQKP